MIDREGCKERKNNGILSRKYAKSAQDELSHARVARGCPNQAASPPLTRKSLRLRAW